MKALAWLARVLAAILALGSFLALVDLVTIEIGTGDIYVYEDIGIALVLFCGSAYVTVRTFRRIRRQPHKIEAAEPQ